ncbi:tRNA uridine-5-carboxymethylaminomethyl(34) synthesis GTPase MnmE [uncultured Sphingomonas sp.]|uniref:tRNA uridine-5-carboxymethylaminomethyl(34) synthesis GTPase MnmE n=1 Tax=uncultured Sphingomonas sp. TaxID=158754 RepID=UPI0026282CC7|nr:tRNA uridine-5-carboxymethylaminomethyl(34) synthesis GTPase MnmE [uncultured Sphingomonas sp.]
MARANKPDAADSTIYALSSGAPPAAIAIVRISGPDAGATLAALAGSCPSPRTASLRRLRDQRGELLDHALLLWMPGPCTATGEDLAELHLHGGRAVVAAVFAALAERGLRQAEPGEFTRRALFNGRLDLSAVEGLADLLAAETESQRREAMRRADGMLGRKLDGWMRRLVEIAAALEAALDYDGDDDVAQQGSDTAEAIAALTLEIGTALAAAPAERLRDGVRIAIVGPPNAGKSTLFNALVGEDAAIVSAIAGTTRDAIERPVALAGMPVVLVDTAGVRDALDPIEAIGVDRALRERARADIVLDLAGEQTGAAHVIAVAAKADVAAARAGALPVSALTGAGLAALRAAIATVGAGLLPRDGEVALDRRYRDALAIVHAALASAAASDDPLITADEIRVARAHLDGLIGGGDVEAMLDALFGRFCLGK